MKVIADTQIPLLGKALQKIAEVIPVNGRDISPEILNDSDALLVRSVTRVDEALLKSSRVKYVATATSGTDHVDVASLAKNGIGFDSAHGSNARAVAEYVLSALFVIDEQYQIDIFKKTIGIIGCGMVGSMLHEFLDALQIKTLLHDPPLQQLTGDTKYCSLDEVLQADIISLHVPLTDVTEYPTFNLINEKTLARMKPDAILVNTARGSVVNESDLLQSFEQNARHVVLDVWQNEPEINATLLTTVTLGTPHIAGYSIDAKIRATKMVVAGLCKYFSIRNDWDIADEWQMINRLSLDFDNSQNDEDIVIMAVLSHYDIRSDAASLRRVVEIDDHKRGYFFDQLRKNYPVRREFSATAVHIPAAREILGSKLRRLGFDVIEKLT